MSIYIVWYDNDEDRSTSIAFITLDKVKALSYAEKSYYYTVKEYEVESSIQDCYIVGKEITE